MKAILVAAAVLGALIARPAAAADMAVKAPPLAPPVFSWSGCYLGGNVGGAWARENVSTSGTLAGNQAPAFASLNGSSAVGGVQAGCNLQVAATWVAGLEADWDAARIRGSGTYPNLFFNGAPVGAGGFTFSRTTDWLASFRGRIGFIPTPNSLLYVTGGAAWARSDFNGFDAGAAPCPGGCRSTIFSADQHGWVGGGGVEWAPWRNNWLLRAEYLYYRLSGATSSVTFASTTGFFWGNVNVSEARVGVSYKFGAPGKL